MFRFEITSNGSEIQRMLQNARREHPRAAATALNRVASSVRSVAVKSISADMGIKQKMIRSATQIRKATPGNALTAVIEARGKGIPVILLKPSPKKVIRPQPGEGVTYQKSKGSRTLISGAFIGRRKSTGKLAVWKRSGRRQGFLNMQFSSSIPTFFEQIQSALRAVVSQRFPIEFRSALKFFKGKG